MQPNTGRSESQGRQEKSHGSNYLRLLKLPAEIQVGIRDNRITMGHARTLVTIEDPKDQLKLFYQIIEKDLSVRKVEGSPERSKETC